MPQTPSQEPVDLVQTNDTDHDTNTERIPSPSPTPIREDPSATNTARMPSPNPISTQEDSPATDIKRMPSPNPTSTQDPPTTNPKRMPSSTPTPTQEDPPTSHQPEVVPHEPCEDSSTNPRSSPPPLPSSKTDISSDAPIDTQTKPNGQNTQIEQTQLSQPHEDLSISKDPLDAHDWTELEERFHAEMEQCANRENGIQEAFDDLLNVNLLLPALFIRTEMYQ